MLRDFLYTKEYRAGPTSNPHFMARLLILRDYKYLGSYQLDSENLPTRIIGSTIEFPGMERGRNVIGFSESGPGKTPRTQNRSRLIFIEHSLQVARILCFSQSEHKENARFVRDQTVSLDKRIFPIHRNPSLTAAV